MNAGCALVCSQPVFLAIHIKLGIGDPVTGAMQPVHIHLQTWGSAGSCGHAAVHILVRKSQGGAVQSPCRPATVPATIRMFFFL